MNRRQILLGGGLLLALGVAVFGERAPADDAADLVAVAPRSGQPPRAGPPVGKDATGAGVADAPLVLRLKDRPAPLERLAPPEGESGLFRATNWDPPPKPVAAAPPTAPPIPYAYVGKQFDEQGWSVFLSRGDEVRVVRAGAALDGQYRVDRIAPPQLVLSYLPLNQQQTINIGSAE